MHEPILTVIDLATDVVSPLPRTALLRIQLDSGTLEIRVRGQELEIHQVPPLRGDLCVTPAYHNTLRVRILRSPEPGD